MWFRQPAAAPVATTIPKTFILVAALAIPTGTLIRLDDMKWVQVATTEMTSGMIVGASADKQDDTIMAGYVGAVARHAFPMGAALTSDGMVKPTDSDFLGAALRAGYRAVPINVDGVQSTSGLVVPGDRVDVILTQAFQGQGTIPGDRIVGETVLHDLRVIAVDQTLVSAAKPAAPANIGYYAKLPRTYTLEMTEH